MWFLKFCAAFDKFMGLLGRIALLLFALSPIILALWIIAKIVY